MAKPFPSSPSPPPLTLKSYYDFGLTGSSAALTNKRYLYFHRFYKISQRPYETQERKKSLVENISEIPSHLMRSV